MASIACDVPNNDLAHDGFVTIAPKSAPARAGDDYVAIDPNNVAITSESQSLSTKSNLLSPKFPPYKIKSYMTRSSRTRAASENIESYFKHRKSSKGSSKTAMDEKILTSRSLGSSNLGEMLAPARWDGYVHIAPKSATSTSESQPPTISSSSLSPTSPTHYLKPCVIRSYPSHSASECTESHASPRQTPGILSNPEVDERQTKPGIPITDNLGAITPALLARYYLPGILLNHGPLAIRHIMSFLTSAVPGFSRISPAKSRRLVVSALERRVSEGIVEDLECNVIFEKVGWGRWNARPNGRSGSPSRIITYPGSPSSCQSDSQILKKNELKYDEIRLKKLGTSLHDDSVSFSHGDDMEIDVDIKMAAIETDRISLDTHEIYYSSSEPLDDDELMSYDSSDTTDDEDWAALGAAALRAASYSTSSNSTKYLSSLVFNEGYRGDGAPALSTLAKSSPKRLSTFGTNIYTYKMTPNSQERDAVEALIHLGSV